MTGTQVTVPLQVMCQFMAAGLLAQNMTVPLIPKQAVDEITDRQELPCGYVAFPEFRVAYKKSDVSLTYNEARRKCLDENGQMAVIDSREKVEKILNHFGTDHHLAVGLFRVYGIREWTTVDGKSTNDLPWKSGEPAGDHDCVYLSVNSRGLINEGCGVSNRYLCEIALPRN